MSNEDGKEGIREWDIPRSDVVRVDRPVLKESRAHRVRKRHVRFVLALGMLIIIGAMSIIGAIQWAIGAPGDLKDLVVLMSPITALAGAVFAFYFTDARKKGKH